MMWKGDTDHLGLRHFESVARRGIKHSRCTLEYKEQFHMVFENVDT